MAFPVRIRFRVFERLNPKQFEHCFEQWVNQLVQELGIQVIIDGKNLRVPMSESLALRHCILSVRGAEHRLVLAQSKVQDKSNEITAIPALLELLDVKGCIVTLMPWAPKPSRLRFSGRKPTTSSA